MEAQMKAICDGRTTRNDVVQQNLEQYRAVFNRTAQQINVLKSVSQYSLTDVWSSLI
jgi:DNA topoisomerase-3